MRVHRSLLVVVFLAACSGSGIPGPLLDGGPVLDGGPALDGGPVFDGGAALDGGPTVDGGPALDGGAADGGVDTRTWPAADFARRVVSVRQDPQLEMNVYFSPQDDTRGLVLRELERTHSKLHLAMFNLRDAEVGNRLLAMHDGGVPLQILFDKKQADLSYNTLDDTLAGAGIDLVRVEITTATDATLHDKFAIFDDARVITGSANWSVTGFGVNHEHFVTMQGGGWPAVYEAEFQEILAGTDTAGSYDPSAAVNVIFSPEDRLDLRVKARIDAAQKRILVAMFDFTSEDLRDALVAAVGRGVSVVLVTDKEQAATSTLDEDLETGGVVVVRAAPPCFGSACGKLHEKYAVFDDERVILGSFNWTNLATHFNQENLVEAKSARLAARVTGNFIDLLKEYDPAYTNIASPPTNYGFTAGTVQVVFEVEPPPNLRADDTLFVGGDVAQLGSWNRSQGIEMTKRGSDGWWEATVMLPAGPEVEFKFLVRDRFGTFHWEGGPKHFYRPVFDRAQQRWADVYFEPPTP